MIHLAGGITGLVLGALLGSFIATLCLRWPEGRTVLRGRSVCDRCGAAIPAIRLIPLVSAVASGGRASCCGATIDRFHSLVELAAALIGGAALGALPSLQGLGLAALGWLLLPLLVLDFRHFWLPAPLVVWLALGGLALGSLLNDVSFFERMGSCLVAGLGLALIGWIYAQLRHREGLGAGDPKLLGAIALWLGPNGTIATLLGAALIGLAEALLRRRSRDEALPFGTFLCIAAWLVAAAQTFSLL